MNNYIDFHKQYNSVSVDFRQKNMYGKNVHEM